MRAFGQFKSNCCIYDAGLLFLVFVVGAGNTVSWRFVWFQIQVLDLLSSFILEKRLLLWLFCGLAHGALVLNFELLWRLLLLYLVVDEVVLESDKT